MQWSDIPRDPPDRQLRLFAAILVLALVAVQIWYAQALWEQPFLWLACEAVTWYGLLGLVRPRLLRPVFVGWMIAVFPIGWLVSHVLLAIVFFGVFTPLGLLFRLMGRDVLQRRRQAKQETYWQPKPAPAGLQSYFRQF